MNILLKEFGVKNHKELCDYIIKTPKDKRVIELKELFKKLNVSLNEEGKNE